MTGKAILNHSDRIYGVMHINEPVLFDLLHSKAVRRLDAVLQHGITALLGITRPVSRLEHSLGAMFLVMRLGGSLQEQIAALLHDVSHTAFSHVIDYVFDVHEQQSYHEAHKEHFMARSDLPDILARYEYHWRDFLHEEYYPLLEQPAPALCADRLDYFLRDSLDLGLASPAEVRTALDHVVVWDGRIVVDDPEAARWMGYTYIAADQASWANFREVGLYELTARVLRMALQAGEIDEMDIWTTDAELWAKLQACPQPYLHQALRLISPLTQFAWDDAHPDFSVATKLRTIDPDILVGRGVQRLSELDADFAAYRLAYLREKAGKWPMRIVPGESDKEALSSGIASVLATIRLGDGGQMYGEG